VGWRATSGAVHVWFMDDHKLVRITVALTASLIHRLDERRKHEPDLPDRGALIRGLLEKALSAEEEQRERGRERERGAAGHDSQHSPGVGGSASSKRG
jgi:metal-responsive CopG/Arc/MetJ family transcriptional regulator